MRSRILSYKNNIANYDLLTQFPIQSNASIPEISFFCIKIKNIPSNDIRQICLNLVSIQLIGNKYTICNSIDNNKSLVLKTSKTDAYFTLENVFLLFYINSLVKNQSTIKGKQFLNVLEYFAADSNFLKLVERMTSKHLSITFSYQMINSKDSSIASYTSKALCIPFF